MEFAAYLRGNKLSNTIYENYDDILEKACQAWMPPHVWWLDIQASCQRAGLIIPRNKKAPGGA
jgi:hypothetical protein